MDIIRKALNRICETDNLHLTINYPHHHNLQQFELHQHHCIHQPSIQYNSSSFQIIVPINHPYRYNLPHNLNFISTIVTINQYHDHNYLHHCINQQSTSIQPTTQFTIYLPYCTHQLKSPSAPLHPSTIHITTITTQFECNCPHATHRLT